MFKIIKTVNWETADKKKGVTYVVAYKGRVFTVVGEDFENLKISADKKTLNLGEKAEIVLDTYQNELGETKQGARLKPIMDLSIAGF